MKHEDENYQTYIVNLALPENHKIVLRLFKEYIRDRSGTELPNGEFLVLVKNNTENQFRRRI
jgi:hypothetical protein